MHQLYIHRVPKKIPDIIDCNLKKADQILIVFNTNIPDTTGHQVSVKFPHHPPSVPALPGELRRSEILHFILCSMIIQLKYHT